MRLDQPLQPERPSPPSVFRLRGRTGAPVLGRGTPHGQLKTNGLGPCYASVVGFKLIQPQGGRVPLKGWPDNDPLAASC